MWNEGEEYFVRQGKKQRRANLKILKSASSVTKRERKNAGLRDIDGSPLHGGEYKLALIRMSVRCENIALPISIGPGSFGFLLIKLLRRPSHPLRSSTIRLLVHDDHRLNFFSSPTIRRVFAIGFVKWTN